MLIWVVLCGQHNLHPLYTIRPLPKQKSILLFISLIIFSVNAFAQDVEQPNEESKAYLEQGYFDQVFKTIWIISGSQSEQAGSKSRISNGR